MAASPTVFYFDADCGFCQQSARLLRLLTDAHLGVLPAHRKDQRVPVVVAEEIATHAVAHCGDEYFYGHEAIGQVLRAHGSCAGIRLVGNLLCIEAMRPFWGWGYRLIAKNRHRLSRLVGASVCELG